MTDMAALPPETALGLCTTTVDSSIGIMAREGRPLGVTEVRPVAIPVWPSLPPRPVHPPPDALLPRRSLRLPYASNAEGTSPCRGLREDEATLPQQDGAVVVSGGHVALPAIAARSIDGLTRHSIASPRPSDLPRLVQEVPTTLDPDGRPARTFYTEVAAYHAAQQTGPSLTS